MENCLVSTTALTSAGKKGDIRIAFGFMQVEGYGLPEPCIHLYTLRNKNIMVQLPSAHMYKFDERDRDPITKEPKCLKDCERIAEMLYGMPTSYGASRVLSAISEWMTDVKNLPPPSTFRNPEAYLEEMKRLGMDVAEAY